MPRLGVSSLKWDDIGSVVLRIRLGWVTMGKGYCEGFLPPSEV